MHVETLKKGFEGLIGDGPLAGLFNPTSSVTVTVDKIRNHKPFEPGYKYVAEIVLNGNEIRQHEEDYRISVLRLRSRCPELFNF